MRTLSGPTAGRRSSWLRMSRIDGSSAADACAAAAPPSCVPPVMPFTLSAATTAAAAATASPARAASCAAARRHLDRRRQLLGLGRAQERRRAADVGGEGGALRAHGQVPADERLLELGERRVESQRDRLAATAAVFGKEDHT